MIKPLNPQFSSHVKAQVSYGNQDCQASKDFDKHVLDGDASIVDV